MPRAEKWCWVATETKRGWRLKLCIGNKAEYPLRGLLLESQDDVAKVVAQRGKTVYMHLASRKAA